MFEIGSVTKTFTATILATMVLDHSVNLDDPVAKFLPSHVRVPSRNGKQITLLNLATQHSGLPRLPSNMDASAADPYADYTIAQMYEFLNSYKLTRDPGAEFEYSNFSIGLLGVALVKRAYELCAIVANARAGAAWNVRDGRINSHDAGPFQPRTTTSITRSWMRKSTSSAMRVGASKI